MNKNILSKFAIALLASVSVGSAMADCNQLPSHFELQSALSNVVGAGNAGLENDMWATLVNG